MYELRHYTDPEGHDLFAHWLDHLQDRVAQVRVAVRLLRLQNGNFGDFKPVGSGVWELRVDWGPGYRVYYAIAGSGWFCSARVATKGRNRKALPARSSAGTNGKRGAIDENLRQT
jgi:putative addiction module killer protein